MQRRHQGPRSPTRYAPSSLEQTIARRWDRAQSFAPSARARRGQKPFSVVLPPPNITGTLHLGHALNGVLQDVLVRYHRMRGDDTVWVPGTDHAGIATQNVVERSLREEGKTRHDLGREQFVERVWAWKEEYGHRITQQLKTLGLSCDWSRERFTLDPAYTRAVQEAFLHYAKAGLITRGERIVNWCPRCASAISDLEVVYVEEDATLYTITYGPLALATVRPETKFGDTGVAVHPDDDRYRQYVGKEIEIDTVLGPARIRVVADAAVDPAFGTGVIKVTPAHDFTDFEIGQRHGLPPRQVIGEDGRMTEHAGPFAGLSVPEARAAVVAALQQKGLLVKEEPYPHRVGTCARCGTAIEPLISKQWFLKMAPLAAPAIEVLERGLIRFHPPRWREAVLAWLRGGRDWCISRQLWWGHRIPAWWCQTGMQRSDVGGQKSDPTPDRRSPTSTSGSKGHYVVSIAKPKRCPHCDGRDFVQDPDVLDTWFSSALWPFAVFGWPEATSDLRRFTPTSLLVTAPDILSLWVARMVFSGLEFLDGKRYLPAKQYGKRRGEQRVTFRDVLVHPTVLTVAGKRMSKSKGIGVDPLDLIAAYGADATRFGLLLQYRDDAQSLRFDEAAVRAARNFVNKVWNVAWFLERWGKRRAGRSPAPTIFDRWMQTRLAETTAQVTEHLEHYRAGDAARLLHDFVWDDLADWYLEVSKVPGLASPDVAREVFRRTLGLLHPFLPFVTEGLFERFGDRKRLLAVSPWPDRRRVSRLTTRDVRMISAFQQVVRDLRSARALFGLPPSAKLRVRVGGIDLKLLVPAIAFLAGCSEVHPSGTSGTWVVLPSSGRVPVAIDRAHFQGIDLQARLEGAERRVRDLRGRVGEEEDRLAAMVGKARSEIVGAHETRLAHLRQTLRDQEAVLAALRRMVS